MYASTYDIWMNRNTEQIKKKNYNLKTKAKPFVCEKKKHMKRRFRQ